MVCSSDRVYDSSAIGRHLSHQGERAGVSLGERISAGSRALEHRPPVTPSVV